MADKRLSRIEEAEKRLTELRGQYVSDVAAALEGLEQANEGLVEAIAAAREAGVTYREMADATGRSHEYFRALLLRSEQKR
jgi:hypothetical protein